jgi:hypothetical protein
MNYAQPPSPARVPPNPVTPASLTSQFRLERPQCAAGPCAQGGTARVNEVCPYSADGARLNTRRALFDPVQDRLGTLKVITPGHPLIPPGHPEVGQRAARSAPAGPTRAPAAYDDVERPVRQAVVARQPRRHVPSSRTSVTSGGRPVSSPATAGMAPSHRAARRTGALFGQNPPTQTGTCGRCTGVGRKTTPSIVTWLPR